MSKSELKRLCTVDPIGMAEKMAKQEEEITALREKNAELQRQLDDAHAQIERIEAENTAAYMSKVDEWAAAVDRAQIAEAKLAEQEKQEPVYLNDIYAAWHGAGVDIAGGDWNSFVKMLAVAILARSGK